LWRLWPPPACCGRWALGLPTVTNLVLGACLGPLLVAVPVFVWFYTQPLERRQRLFGVPVTAAPAPPEEEQPDTVD